MIVISLNGYLHGSIDFENPVQLHRWIDNVPYIYGRKDSVDSLLKGQGKVSFILIWRFLMLIGNGQLVWLKIHWKKRYDP